MGGEVMDWKKWFAVAHKQAPKFIYLGDGVYSPYHEDLYQAFKARLVEELKLPTEG